MGVVHQKVRPKRFSNISDNKLRTRLNQFARKIHPKSVHEFGRLAISNYKNPVAIHEDSNNCPLLSNVLVYSRMRCSKKEEGDTEFQRVSLIFTFRKSIYDHLKKNIYMLPLLKQIIAYAEEDVNIDRNVVTKSIFPESVDKSPIFVPTMMDRLVYVSCYVHRIEEMREKFSLDILQVIGLMFSVICSNSPQPFMNVTSSWMNNRQEETKANVLSLKPWELCYSLYNDVMDAKLCNTHNKGRRFQPVHNKRLEKKSVEHNFFSICRIAYAAWSNPDISEGHLVSKCLMIISDDSRNFNSCCGVGEVSF